MKIITRADYIWDDTLDRYVLVRENSHDYFGPIAECKGASSTQNSLNQSQTAFYNTLTQDYNQQFANQNAILSSLNSSLSPIISAGPNQFGFNATEVNNLNSQAISGTAQQYNAAQKALQENQAAAGGGNAYLPSGVNAQQNEQLASTGANQTSSELLGIQQAGYTQGYNQYESAIGQEESAAGLYNPTGYASSATSAGNAAASEANTIQQENAAASPWSILGGVLGAAASGVTGALTGGLSTALGGVGGGLNAGLVTSGNSLSTESPQLTGQIGA